MPALDLRRRRAPRPPARVVAGVPGLVAVAAVAAACAVVTGLGSGWSARLGAGVLAVLALAGSTLVLRRRARATGTGGTDRTSGTGPAREHADDEREVWLWLSRALAVLTLGAAGQLLADAGAGLGLVPAPVGPTVFGVAVLTCALPVYQGLIRWNRHRTLVADPGDWLNGLSAVFALVAAADLVITWTGSSLSELPWWVLQGSLFRLAAALMLVGTTATIASLGGLQRDARVWGVASALAVGAGAEAVALAGGPDAVAGGPLLGWVLAGVVLAGCALPAPADAGPQAATTQAPTIGALVVLLASVTVLVLDGARLARQVPAPTGEHGASAAAVCAVIAVVGVAVRVVHLVRDLDGLAQTRLEAQTDELTGVANRRALVARLGAVAGGGGPVALLVLDVDRFKEVNDRYGHATGDALLRSVAGRLAALVPPSGLLARQGGDEFAVVVPFDEEGAVRLAHALADAVRGVVEVEGHPVRAAASIGVARAATGVDGAELLRRADTAMYRAKTSGTAVARYDEELDRAARERAALLEDLRTELDPATGRAGAQIVVHYQPQLDLTTREVAGVEALVRWQHPRRGLLAPDSFLDLVEQHGMMPQVTSVVLWTAARQAARWHAAGRRWRVSVNVSTSVLDHADLLPLLDEVLATTGVDPALLVLEVTETTLMTDPERGLRAAREVAARGVGVSIDDYGTGHSSLAYLSDLPASELKLDRAFVSRLVEDERTGAIVAATVGLAHRLGLRLVAEGVEDEDTLEALRRLGCDESQGYLHTAPVPAEVLERWSVAHRDGRVHRVPRQSGPPEPHGPRVRWPGELPAAVGDAGARGPVLG